jgi:hypothetical protein
MAELSKTARASLGKQVKEVHVETTEEAIKAIRDNRAAGLFVGDMSRVDKLLAAYDKLQAEMKVLAEAGTALIKNMIPEAIVLLEDTPVGKTFDHSQCPNPGVCLSDPTGLIHDTAVVMATIPAQEHDEHHLVDFGHDNTHPIAEGA